MTQKQKVFYIISTYTDIYVYVCIFISIILLHILHILFYSVDGAVAGPVPHADRAGAARVQDERVLRRRQAAHRVQVGEGVKKINFLGKI